ncbi:MAG: Rpn family recombination-promoting nuclease/putative transposase [Candidatus Electrothrix sp.]
MDNPHDSVVRQTLGRPEVAIGYFRHNLPKDLLDHLDLATLERVQDSFVDPELHPSASDLLFTVDYLAEGDAKGEQEKLLLCTISPKARARWMKQHLQQPLIGLFPEATL